MNPSPHSQAILVFGVILPFAVLGAIGIGAFSGHSKIDKLHREKLSALERFETAQSQVSELEGFLTKDNRREKAVYWNSKMSQDVVESLTKNLDKILAKYDPEVLHQTEMGQATGGGIGSRFKFPSSRMKLSFEGGFKPMQLLLAELETEMPNLVLEDLSIQTKPSTAEGKKGTLQFSVTYLCWEKAKETSNAQP